MTGLSVGERLKIVNENIRIRCQRANRNPESVKILAVSKGQGLAKIRDAFECGLRDFAENYVQEALGKIEQLENLPVNWHFIGRLQSNKVKQVVGRFAKIHSIDRPELVTAVEKHADHGPQEIFLQFNVAGETTKGGADKTGIRALVERFAPSRRIRMMGLMVMPPFTDDPETTRPYFREARQLLDELREKMNKDDLVAHPMNELSMGTSQDYGVAIEEGATWIRIGSEIFGPREVNK